jgi:hypothetical protein
MNFIRDGVCWTLLVQAETFSGVVGPYLRVRAAPVTPSPKCGDFARQILAGHAIKPFGE